MPDNRSNRSFAWDGMEFPLPADWDLSVYSTRRRVTSLVFEDAISVKLELDYTVAAGATAAAQVQKHHAALASELHELALNVETVTDVPEQWVVFLYTLPEAARLATALHLGEQFPLLVFARFHATGVSRREIMRVVRSAVKNFRYHDGEHVAWRVFDMTCRVPRHFRLVETSFLAGRKMMLFEHRFRRLFIWRLSMADRLLRDRTVAEVAAEFLNRFNGLPGARFMPDGADRLQARRNRWHPFGHYEEIGRFCFRYAAAAATIPDANALVIAVFHYRHETDREWLESLMLDEAAGIRFTP